MSGDPAVSFPEVAKLLSEIVGKKVPFIPISDQEFLDLKTAEGFPDFVTKFVLRWVQGMGEGEWSDQTGDLEKLIGHKPQTVTEFLRRNVCRRQGSDPKGREEGTFVNENRIHRRGRRRPDRRKACTSFRA